MQSHAFGRRYSRITDRLCPAQKAAPSAAVTPWVVALALLSAPAGCTDPTPDPSDSTSDTTADPSDGSTGSPSESADTTGTGTTGSAESGSDDESGTEGPPVEPGCGEVVAPPLAPIATGVNNQLVHVGRCGHGSFRLDDMLSLIEPDGTIIDLGPANTAGEFEPSGQLFTYMTMDFEWVLRDLVSGASIDLGSVAARGFVPSAVRDDGAHAWVCSDGVFSYGGVEGLVDLEAVVPCASLRAARHAPVVAFEGEGHTAWLVDLDEGSMVQTVLDDYWSSGVDPLGRERSDSLGISHDGTVLRHFRSEVLPGDESQVIDFRLYDGALDQIVLTEFETSFVYEGDGPGHTTVIDPIFGDMPTRIWTNSRQIAQLDAALEMKRVLADLERVVAIEHMPGGSRVLRIDLETGQEEELAATGPIDRNLRFSDDESAIGIIADSALCIPLAPLPCVSPLPEFFVWTEAEGLSESRVAYNGEFLGFLDDGTALARGDWYPVGVEQADVDAAIPTPPERACYWDDGAVDRCFSSDSRENAPLGNITVAAGTVFNLISWGDPEPLQRFSPPQTELVDVASGFNINPPSVSHNGTVVAFPVLATLGGETTVWWGGV